MAMIKNRACAALLVVLAGCFKIPPLVDCVSRTDCARDELCQDGQCMAGTSAFRRPTAKPSTVPDAGPNGGDSDSGMMMTDSGAAQIDAGHACINVQNITMGTTHCTVAEAIEMANALDNIVLPPTHIYEHVKIINTPVFLEGRTVDGQKTRIIVQDIEGAIQIGAAGTTLKNIEVSAVNAEAIRIASNATLIAVDILAAKGAGIVVLGGIPVNNVQIKSVTIRAVSVSTGLQLEGAGACIKIGKGVHVNLNAGQITNCAGSGIYIESGELIQTGDTSVSESWRGLEARQLNGEARPLVRLNGFNFSSNRGAGLHLSATDFWAINGVANSNGGDMAGGIGGIDGIYLGAGTSAHVEGNSCKMNAGHGIFCESGVIPMQCKDNGLTGNGASVTGTNCENGCQ